MDPALIRPPDPGVSDNPEPLPPARGSGIYAERLFSINGLTSVALLCWSVLALRRPSLPRAAWAWLCRRFPRFVYGSSR